MTRDLVTSEGVDDASADSTVEAAVETGDVLGEPPHGAPDDDEQGAVPVDMETAESRQARDERGSGQQLQAGEG